MNGYNEFIATKQIAYKETGLKHEVEINPFLFPFQRDIVRWALRKGKAAIFADCGLGKTLMQLEWARHIHEHTGRSILIVAPLAVTEQTKLEGQKISVLVNVCKYQDDVTPGINITNYERLDNFNADWGGIILDESSILKNYSGKTRTDLIRKFHDVPFKLACTATPSPNDFMELGNHSEFLNEMRYSEMLPMFFVHDGGETAKWRLKGHAEDSFWAWVASWAAVMTKPSDLDYDDDGFILPPLNISDIIIRADKPADGFLFPIKAQTLNERRNARRSTIDDRVLQCAELVNNTKDPFLIWCDLNSESSMLTKAIPGAVEIKGADSIKYKEENIIGFSHGDYRVLVTKPSIAGFGVNWQHCHNMAFVGLSDSFEAYYQAVRRCWRFGQKNRVNVYIITSELEGNVIENIKRKERNAHEMIMQMVEHTKRIVKSHVRKESNGRGKYNPTNHIILPEWIHESSN